ncbi:molecular chaperone [Providencia heimbachae]|uniref:fimbrial biogenesis chaperone n=1 Tax=Providencia heimbachae TaxID=333962 RepID=UPI0010BEE119|nr:molecular chaperone [Providencia heimbachae]QCJ69381.1 molecular chaperone [Providencia heimbachae]
MKQLITFLFLAILLSINITAKGEGIRLDQTRLVVNSDSNNLIFSIVNDDSSPYLIQAAITDQIEGQKSKYFIVTPPLFRLDAKNKFSARVFLKNKNELPTDRESLFYLNTRAIPATKESNKQETNAKLTFVTNIIIKVFYRPSHLAVPNNEVFKKVTLTSSGSTWQFNNPTPYYFTIVNINMNHKAYKKSLILPPFNHVVLKKSDSEISQVSWQMINDFGGLTEVFEGRSALSNEK